MKYHGEEALGLIETLGMVPAIYAADKMLKAAAVDLIAYENVGSTLVTIMIKGDVAAVRASVTAGAVAASEVGKLTAQNVMPRPIKPVGGIVSVHTMENYDFPTARPGAIGLIETFGIVYVLEAADAMLKEADVELIGYENVASGYVSVLVQGDMVACEAAVAAGVKAVEDMGTSVYSSVVIAAPHPDVMRITKRYALVNLLP